MQIWSKRMLFHLPFFLGAFQNEGINNRIINISRYIVDTGVTITVFSRWQSAEIRRLRLQQYHQLRSCEQDTKQVWIVFQILAHTQCMAFSIKGYKRRKQFFKIWLPWSLYENQHTLLSIYVMSFAKLISPSTEFIWVVLVLNQLLSPLSACFQVMEWIDELCLVVTKDFSLPHNMEEVEQLFSELKRLQATAEVSGCFVYT